MHYLVFENVQISFVVILLIYIGTSSSASLFGLDFSAAEKDVKTRYDRMLKPDLPLDKLEHDSQNGGMDTLVKMNSLGSFNSEDEFGNTNPTITNTDTSELVADDSSVTLGWSDIGTDYTTETSDYETNTEEELERIGAPAPAVLATLLG